MFESWVKQKSRLLKEVQILGFSLGIVALGVSAVVNLVQGVSHVPAVADWDQAFVVAAHSNIEPWEITLFEVTTSLAGRLASLVIGFVVGFWLLAKRKKRLLALWVIGLVGNSVIVQIIKQTQERARPSFLEPLLNEPNFSFPSGHASASVLMYGLLAYIILRSLQDLGRGQRIALVLTVLWTGVFVGTSRLALGVHYPTDVLAGWLIAMSWLTLLITCDLVIRPAARRYNPFV